MIAALKARIEELTQALLSTAPPSDMVMVRREDLRVAKDYLFNRKSLPLVGKDREAGERLKAALPPAGQST